MLILLKLLKLAYVILIFFCKAKNTKREGKGGDEGIMLRALNI